MQTTQLIAQIALLTFVIIMAIQIIRKRKKELSKFHFWMKISAAIILLVWLYFAGAFDNIFNRIV